MYDEITDAVIDIIDRNFDTGDAVIGPDTDLDNLGLDSLALIEIAIIIARELRAEMTEDDLADCVTVGDIAKITEEKAGMPRPAASTA
jgi:acyl carrier protein